MGYKEVESFLDTTTTFLSEKLKMHPKTRPMRVESFNEIQENIETFTGKAAQVLLYRFGEISAENMIKRHKIKLDNYGFQQLIKICEEEGQKLNWYNVQSSYIDNNKAIISLYSTFESAMHKKVPFRVCSFIRGYFNKVSNSSKLGFICKCEETSCVARGDDYCIFEIERTK